MSKEYRHLCLWSYAGLDSRWRPPSRLCGQQTPRPAGCLFRRHQNSVDTWSLGEFLWSNEALQKILPMAMHPRATPKGLLLRRPRLELGSLPLVPGSARVGLAHSKHMTQWSYYKMLNVMGVPELMQNNIDCKLELKVVEI